jgi:hypothetical protein
MLSVQEAMQSVQRAMLHFVPEKGWALTDVEGVEWKDLLFFRDPTAAVRFGLSKIRGLPMTANAVVPVALEDRLFTEIERLGYAWSCEWWHGSDGQKHGDWLRPMFSEAAYDSLTPEDVQGMDNLR